MKYLLEIYKKDLTNNTLTLENTFESTEPAIIIDNYRRFEHNYFENKIEKQRWYVVKAKKQYKGHYNDIVTGEIHFDVLHNNQTLTVYKYMFDFTEL